MVDFSSDSNMDIIQIHFDFFAENSCTKLGASYVFLNLLIIHITLNNAHNLTPFGNKNRLFSHSQLIAGVLIKFSRGNYNFHKSPLIKKSPHFNNCSDFYKFLVKNTAYLLNFWLIAHTPQCLPFFITLKYGLFILFLFPTVVRKVIHCPNTHKLIARQQICVKTKSQTELSVFGIKLNAIYANFIPQSPF